jgi:PGF-pre-PGF domain-containing protein
MQNSTASDTTKTRSNNINTTVDLSTETDTNATNSNLANANLTLCSLLRSTTTNTNGSTCNLTDVIAANSNFTSFDASNCIIGNTNVTSSVCRDSTFNNTRGTGWNVDPSNVTNSYCADSCNVSDSNVRWSNISLSTFYSSNFNNSNINLSSANGSSAYDSDVYNSTLVNISATNSDINDSSLRSSGTSFISISTIRLVTLSSNYTIINSTLTNVNLYGSGTIQDSTITDSTLNDTSVYRSTITGMTAGNTTINDSTITNPTLNLTDSVINLANINDGLLIYGSITYNGTTYYGSASLSSIYAPGGPVVNGIECANATQVFGPCINIGYGETIWKVHANVTKRDYAISNVVFKLENADDNNKTIFYGGWVERNGTEYRFYWNQPVLDSGTFNLTVTATDTNDQTASNSTSWSTVFGTLNVTTAPGINTDVAKNQTFGFNATYSCSVGECGDVNAILSYNDTLFSASPSTPVNSSTVSCLGGMGSGSSCTVSWSITAIGNKTQQSEFFAQAVPIDYTANVSAVNSTAINITIINSPPTTPVIVSPISGSSVSNLTVNFDWSDSTDVDGDSFNYTIQVDNNSDYSSPENVTNVTDSNSNATFTVASTGTWYWLVRAYDAENQSANATAFVVVSLGGGGVTDTTPPLIVLNSPANSAYAQNGTVTFVYIPSEQLSEIANCSLYINGALNQTNSTTVTNNGENNFTATLNTEADYNWMVGCTDTSSNAGNATPRAVRIDSATPTITAFAITYPSGQSKVKSGQSVIIDVDASDTGSGVSSVTLNCTPLGSGFVGATLQSGSSASGTWRATCLVSGLSSEGNVTVSASAVDAVGFSAPDFVNVSVDNVAPINPAYLNISDWPTDADGIVNLSWSASASTDVAQYNIYRSNVGGFVPTSGLLIGYTDGATLSFIDVPASDGKWYWKVTAVDDVGNENLTGAPENYTTVNTQFPSVALTGPSTSVQLPNGNINFTYVPSDATDSIASCTLYINGTFITTNTTAVENYAENGINYTLSAEGNYTWTVGCANVAGHARNATSRALYIDNSTPIIAITNITYPNGLPELAMNGSVVVDVSANDTGTGISNVVVNCSQIGSGLVTATRQSGTVNVGMWRATCAASVQSGTEDNKTISAATADGVGFEQSAIANASIDTLAPANPNRLDVNSSPFDNDGNIVLNWTDVGSDVAYYKIYRSNVGGFTPVSGLLIGTNTTAVFNDKPPSDGTWYWRITAVDNVGNENLTGAPENYTTIDTSAFTVNLNAPADSAWMKSADITFRYTPSGVIANCSLYIDGALNDTNSTVVNNAVNNFTVSIPIQNTYTWTVGCVSPGGNSHNATERTLYIDAVQPNVSSVVVGYTNVFNKTTNGDTVTINAVVSDIGGSGVANVVMNCSQLGSGFVAATLQSGSSASGTWRANCPVSGTTLDLEQNLTVSINATDAVGLSGINTTDVTVDNAAPANPTNLAVDGYPTDSDGDVTLSWPNSTSDDRTYYKVYRSNVADFTPVSGLLIATNVISNVYNDSVPSDGTWYWKVTTVDNMDNENLTGVPQNYTLVDTGAPTVALSSPSDGVYVQFGNITFAYTPSGETNTLANCTLYLNGVATITNTTPVSDTQNTFIADIQTQASYAWTVGCVDTSSNARNATSRTLNVDNATPTVDAIAIGYPSGQTKLKDGQSISVNVTTSDTGSGVSSVTVNCTSIGAGLVAATLQSGNSANGIWRATCLLSGLPEFEGDVNISATALDGVGFYGANITAVAVDNLAPANPASLSVITYPADIDGVVNLAWPNSTSPDITTFNIYRSNVANFTPASGLLIGSTNVLAFTDVPASDGTWYWKVTAVDNVGNENLTNAYENYTLVDTGAPTISNLALTYPPLAANPAVTQTRVKNGDVLRIRVDAADPQNVSTVWVDVSNINTSLTNETMASIGGDVYEYNATIGGTIGDADQQIRIYANDTSGNVRNGVASTVAIDNTLPTSFAIDDDGNFTSVTTSIHASWSYSDSDSSALGYNYTIYNNLGETIVDWTFATSTDITKAVSPPLSEGLTYFWYVKAYDGAGNEVSNTTAPEGITVDTTPPSFLYVYDAVYAAINWTNSTTNLNASWLAQDLESGVRRYFYRIGEDSNSDGIVDAYFVLNTTDGIWRFGIAGNNTSAWANVGSNTSVNATIYNMTTSRRYYFEVKVENWAGVAALGRSDGINVDTAGPFITLTVVPNSTYVNYSAITFTPNCTDPLSGVADCKTYLRYNYSTWTLASTTQGSQSYSMTSDGVYEWLVNATDNVGNPNSSAIVWVARDTVAPNTTATAKNSTGANALSNYTNVPILVNLTVVDNNSYNVNVSGAANVSWSLDFAAFNETVSNVTFNVTIAGVHSLRFYARDIAGNQESMKNVTILAMENSSYDANSTLSSVTLINVTIANSNVTSSNVNYSAINNSIINNSIVLNSTIVNSTLQQIEAINATISGNVLTSGFVRCIANALTYMAPAAKSLTGICTPPTVTPPVGGGGGGSTVTSESQAISSIAADACADAVYTRFSEHGVQTIQLCVNHKVMNVGIRITPRGPASTPVPGFAYNYMDIFTTGLNDENIVNVTFEFAVSNAWIAQNSIDYRSVKLYRWQASSWHEIVTMWTSSDSTYHYYSAVSPGLSMFAISGSSAQCPAECQAPSLWGTCADGQTSRTEYTCNIDTGFSCAPETVTKSCAPGLLCPTCQTPSDWSACAEGMQTRTEYICSAETNYQCVATPAARACEMPAACSACPEPSLWTDCTNGQQYRSAYRCGPETSYACVRVDETHSCLPPEALLVTAAAIVLILGLGMVITVRRRTIARWWRKAGKAKFAIPKITMPRVRHAKQKPYKPKKIVKAAPQVLPIIFPALPTIRPKLLHMPGKPKYVCSVCGKPEVLVHWCEECGKETCIEHIHKVGTKLLCDTCMKKKKLM